MGINNMGLCNFRYSDPNTKREGQLSENLLPFLSTKTIPKK